MKIAINNLFLILSLHLDCNITELHIDCTVPILLWFYSKIKTIYVRYSHVLYVGRLGYRKKQRDYILIIYILSVVLIRFFSGSVKVFLFSMLLSHKLYNNSNFIFVISRSEWLIQFTSRINRANTGIDII